ncbi:MAG: beta-ketoacyl-ACP synthase II [Lentisphaerae bacterium]|jgi:3-oxoacyl-[acyl-carrier-protein] synthase II|nr:beta-ketoacyl-ACP synthase II [Lentisphaerota bacterium]
MSTNTKRIVVTGLGAVTSLGNSVADSWKALLEGKSGIARITKFDPTDYRCQIAGEIKDLDIAAYVAPKEVKRLDPFCHYAVVAGDEALKQAGLIGDNAFAFDPTRAGVIVSSGIGGIGTVMEQAAILNAQGPSRVSSLTVPMMISDMASGYLAIRNNMQGPNFGLVSACASGLHSIGEAYWVIVRGDADIMLAGGAEAGVVGLGQAGFSSMKALSTRNDEPTRACRPFDKDRNGFVPAEGAGVLVLESEEHARNRGANILAEIVGYGLSADAFHITAPREDGDGAKRAMAMAFNHAQIPVEKLDYVNAHGTSTHLNDKMETAAIKTVLGEHAYKTAISSTKSMTGHMLGAAGGFESVVCVKAIEEGIIPPTINYETPDPECDLDYTPNKPREMQVNLALNNSLGFGGHNASVLFAKYR